MKKFIFLFLLVNYSLLLAAGLQDNKDKARNDSVIQEVEVDGDHETSSRSFGDGPNCPVAHAIDLGLPSGTKWASWNVGASAPWEYGNYYAWGETDPKDIYNWETYTYCNGSFSTCRHIGNEIAGTKYDVAYVKWGGSWRTPSLDQVKELINCCTRMWIQQNGVYGTWVKGPNGATIFFPAAGNCWNGKIIDEGLIGYYWVSSLYPYHECDGYSLNFNSSYWYWTNNYRSYGFSVRPVCP